MRQENWCFVMLTLIITGCASSGRQVIKPVTPAALALNDDQIRSTLIGKKLNNIGTTGRPYSLSFFADGTEIFLMSGNPPETEHWTVKDGVICFSSVKIPHECYRLKKDQEDYWLVNPDTGVVHYHYTLTSQ
jgi:hypothetical protein